MEKHELFKQAIETEAYSDYNKEDLLSLGISIGSNRVTFRDLYKAYFMNESNYENKPMIGSKIEVLFDRLEDKVIIKRSKIVLEFSIQKFLEYLNLLMICFGEVYPLGSVVEIDETLLNEEFKKAVGVNVEAGISVRAVITGRFVSLRDDSGEYVIEYVGRLRPFGEGSKVAPLLLSRVMIKGVVHSGLADEVEEADVMRLRSELINRKPLSIAFATDEQLNDLFGDMDWMKEGRD